MEEGTGKRTNQRIKQEEKSALVHGHMAEEKHRHPHEHSSTEGHVRHHYHSPEEKKRQLNRLARLIGHLEHIRMMIENDEDCADVLIQLSAVRSALTGLGKEIINEHITHCISHAIEEGDESALQAFQKAIEKFL